MNKDVRCVYTHTHTHTHTHTLEYHAAIKSENTAICNNMDELESYYAKWNKSETNTVRYHLYVEYKKYNKLVIITKKSKLTDIENKLFNSIGERGNTGFGD